MRVIRYNLELIQPVLIPDPQGEANSAISLPYLPGSLLRGGLIGLYRQAFDATDADIRALFLGDATRYLNAYPVKDGQRALPVSAAWRYDKRAKVEGDKAQRTIYNFAHTLQELQEESIDANFIWLKEEGSQGERFSPPRQVNVHTLRNARKGRAVPRDRKTGKYDTDAGTVYRYDALVAGLMLQGMILTEADEQLADKLITLLQQHETLWIGRARRAGYGEVRITVVEDDGRRENGGYNRPEAPQGLQLMLTSDALLRDEWGQTTLDPSVAVAELLGLPHTTFKLKADSAFLTARVVGGFNRKWGLLLPRTLALAAGSTFDLESAEPLSTEQLEQLEQHGIGERRNEGFGQLLVRADERAEIHSERWEPQFSPVQLNLSESEKKLAQTLAERLLRRKLEDELRQLVNRIELENTPLKHQIARLRVLLRELERGRQPHKTIEDEQLKRLTNYLQDVEGRRAGAQLARAQIDEKPKEGAAVKATLPVWIKAQLLPGSEELTNDKYQAVMQAAQQRWSGLQVILGAGVTATVDAATAQEYSLRLVNQVLQRAAKLARAKEKERQDG